MRREVFMFRDPAAARTAAVDSPSVPGKHRRRGNEDWRVEPCQCCKSLAMLWWRFCPFCGTVLPTALDGKVVKQTSKPPRSVKPPRTVKRPVCATPGARKVKLP
jgi:hypothetical protein